MGKSSEDATSSKSDKTSSPVQELPATQAYPDWAAMQAFYGAGIAMPPYFSTAVTSGHMPHPFIWGTQPLMAPFGTPYTAIYPPGVYSHPSMVPGSQVHSQGIAPSSSTSEAAVMATPLGSDPPAKSSNNKGRSPVKRLKGMDASIGNGFVENSSGNAAHKPLHREKDAEDSTEGSDGHNDSGAKTVKRKRSSEGIPASGKDGQAETSVIATHLVMANGFTTVITMPADNAEKPVGTLTPSNPTVGLELKISTAEKANPVSPVTSAMVPVYDDAPGQLSIQDERALKRERRKQSNRESARRSRLRKQAETEELALKVESLTNENTSLRSEISRLNENLESLRQENAALLEKWKNTKVSLREAIHRPVDSVTTENLLSKINSSSLNTNNDQWENDTNDTPNGKLRQLLDSSPRKDAVVAG